MHKLKLPQTIIKRIKYGTQRISARINAVMSVNIKYCILRRPGATVQIVPALMPPLIFVMHRVNCQMEEIALPTVGVAFDDRCV